MVILYPMRCSLCKTVSTLTRRSDRGTNSHMVQPLTYPMWPCMQWNSYAVISNSLLPHKFLFAPTAQPSSCTSAFCMNSDSVIPANAMLTSWSLTPSVIHMCRSPLQLPGVTLFPSAPLADSIDLVLLVRNWSYLGVVRLWFAPVSSIIFW